jgi:UDP-3-O-[3-hydroxymyristoyl] glucosamine N-acyltransferase
LADPRFFRAAGPFTVAAIAERTGAVIGGAGNAELILTDVAPLETASDSELSFLSNNRYAEIFARSRAGAVFVQPQQVRLAPAGMTLLISAAPYMAFAKASAAFYPTTAEEPGVADTSVIDPTVRLGDKTTIGPHVVIGRNAEIGDGVSIGANSVIGDGVSIGDGCRIAANVTLSHCILGQRVVLYPGVRVGQDGFGFASDRSGHVKLPQIGRVLIGDDVEIGANTTIDRGAGPDTIIGAGCMIDNLVQIGHNVVLGRNCVIVAQAGIAGSTKLGDFVVVAAQSGIIGHLTIGDGARIAGKSGVARDVEPGAAVAGIPAVPIRQWHKQTAMLERLVRKKGK